MDISWKINGNHIRGNLIEKFGNLIENIWKNIWKSHIYGNLIEKFENLIEKQKNWKSYLKIFTVIS